MSRTVSAARFVRVLRTVLCAVLLACTLLPLAAQRAWAADAAVVYGETADGTASIAFYPADANLFPNMASMMPGDAQTQEISVSNAAVSGRPAKIYLRSLGYSGGSEEFLSRLLLTVTHEDGRILADDAAHRSGGLSDWTFLGEFAPGESAVLTVRLEMPADLGDSFQHAAGSLRWEFMAEDLSSPADSDDASSGASDGASDAAAGGSPGGLFGSGAGASAADTGDALGPLAALLLGAAAACAAALALLAWRRRRAKEGERP